MLLPLRFNQELRATLKLSAPLAVAQLAQVGMGVTDTVLLGALGRDALAAGGLGGALFFMLAMILQGPAQASGILIAHARGADTPERIAPTLRCGFVLATLAFLPLAAMLWEIETLLIAIGEPASLAADVQTYCRTVLLGAPAMMWLGTQRTYLASMNYPRMVMMVSFAGLILNGVLTYGMIHGRFGLPELGFVGSPAATAITLWVMMIITYVWIAWVPALSRYVTRGSIDWALVRELFMLGWPIAITVAVEALLFLVGALMMGVIGVAPLAAHQVAINIASVTFMIPLATSQAANVRVSFHMGAGSPRAARQAGFAALVLGVGFMFVAAVLMFIFPREIALLFNLDPTKPEDAEAIALVVSLLWICAVFQVFDGAQVIAVGALRGLKDTRIPMILAGIGYWLIGFPVAWILAFTLDMGPTGVWWGLALGLLVAAVVLNVRFLRLTKRLINESPAPAGLLNPA